MSLPWSSKGLKATPVNADELLIIDSADANPSTQNKRITIGTLPSATLPVPDTTAIVEGSVDATKLLRFEVDGFTTGATRVLTPPNADGVIVLEDFAQTLTNKTITAAANTLIIASTDLTDAANIVLNNQTNSYTAGARQNFLGDTSGTSGLNVGGIAGNPTTQVDGDVWLNTSSNILFARINSVDVNLSAAGEVFTWSADHDANGFDLLNVGGITINNPADTFQYIITPDAIAADRILNLPLLTATDTLVTEAFTQTLTNKTIDGDNNTILDINETQMNVTVGVSGTVLTSNGVGLPPTYQSSGSQTPWVSDIDADGFDLTDLSNIEFRETTLPPGAGVQAIYADVAGIIINVPTSDTLLLKINDIGEYSFDATDLDMNQNGLFDVENIVFGETLGAPAGSVHAIYVDTGGMVLNSANTDDFDFQINANSEYVLTTTQAEWNDNDLIEMGILSFSDVNTSLQQSVSDLIIDVATSGAITLRVNDVIEYDFNATTADFFNNDIINATIDGDLNTILDINETQMDVFAGSSGTVLTSNGAGSPPTYQAVAGTGDVIGPGSATDNAIARFDTGTGKLIQNGVITIDDVANMIFIRSLQFTTFTSAPTGTTHIALVDSDFHINTTVGNNLQLMVNDTLEYQFTSSFADFNDNNLLMGTAYIEFSSIATPGDSGSSTVGRLFLDVGNSNHLTIRRNDGIDVDLEGGSQTPWISDIDADGFDLRDLSNIEFRETTAVPLGTIPAIYNEATGITINVLTGDSISLDVNAVTQYTFDATQSDWNGNNLIEMGVLSFSDVNTSIQQSVSNLLVDVSAGGDIVLRVNDSIEYTFNATTADFNNNGIINATIDGDLNTLLDINETQLTVTGGVADTVLTSNGVGIAPSYQSIFPINFPENAGGNATATQDINFSTTDRHSQQFTLIQNTTLTFSGTVASTTEYIDLFIVQDGTGGFTLTLPVGTVNKAEVEAGVNLGAGEETFILLKFAFGTFYAFLQGTTSGEVFTWTADHSMATFKLTATANVILNAPTAVSLEVAATEEYSFNATVADFNGNNLQDVPQILDANGLELLIFTTTASAVNELTLVNAATATPVEIQATGGDADIDVQFTPKGTGTFYGNRETWSWPLTDETTAPTTGVKFTTEPAPYDMTIEDAIAGLTTAGTTSTFTVDVLKEDSVNADTFTTIFSTLPTIDAAEFTSTTAATAPVISVSTWEKGRRLQLSINTLDTGGTARGVKVSLLTHATAK